MGLDLIPLNFPLGCGPGSDPPEFPLGCGPGSDPPEFPPWVWAWRGLSLAQEVSLAGGFLAGVSLAGGSPWQGVSLGGLLGRVISLEEGLLRGVSLQGGLSRGSPWRGSPWQGEGGLLGRGKGVSLAEGGLLEEFKGNFVIAIYFVLK